MRSVDLRSESAVRAIAEFLDLGNCIYPYILMFSGLTHRAGGEHYYENAPKENAEHFTHGEY